MLLEGLKAESKVRTGRAVGPLDVLEGWMRPCRARWAMISLRVGRWRS